MKTRGNRLVMMLLVLGILGAWAVAAPPDESAVSPDGGAEPAVVTWECPRPVDPAALGSGFSAVSGLGIAYATANSDPEGDMPREVAFTPDGATAVIVNRDTDTITFFDVATRTITGTVGTEDFPVDIAVTPDGAYAVAPNVFSDSVTVIDLATRTVAAHIPITGIQPYRVEVTPDSAYAVVGVVNDAVNSSFSVIDLTTLSEVSSFASVSQGVFGFFFTPESGISGNIFTQFALASDGVTIVLPDRGGSQVVLYDRTTGSVLASLPTAAGPTSVDISADGTTAVVAHEGTARTITEIDLGTQTVTGAFTTSADLVNQIVRITPDKNYAIAAISNNLIFVDLTTGATTATISTGTVGDIEISFDGQYAFVSNYNARVIDIGTQTLVKTITYAACAESAASPTELRAVALNNRFREDIHLYNINGAAGFLEGAALSGEEPEGDATRTVAITPDGKTAIAANNTSDNATIFDLPGGSVRAYVPAGKRPMGVAITPDGSTAVVCNIDGDNVSIVDLATDTTVAQLTVIDGPAEVVISPDSQWAYVSSIVGTDRIHFIQLDGANSQVVSSLVAGQMGSIVYTYNVVSGLGLSPDGSVLAACISFDDQLLLIDTATRTEITRVTVGDFPIRVAFSPDGSMAYVDHSFSDDVKVVSINGPSSSVVATIGGIDFPLPIVVDPAGAYVYVGSFNSQTPRLYVIDTSSNAVVATVPLPAPPRLARLVSPDSVLYIGTTAGDLVVLDAAGPATSILDTLALSSGPSDLAMSDAAHVGVVAQPIPDGIDVISLVSEVDCRRGNINATAGVAANVLFVNGSAGSPIERAMTISKDDPFTIFMEAPPSKPGGPSKFALYAWVGAPTSSTVRVLPLDLGISCKVMPPNSVPEEPQLDPKKIWNNIGKPNFLGTAQLPSTPAPSTVLSKPSGVGKTLTFFLQGIELDSLAPQGQAGVTNGVVIVSQ